MKFILQRQFKENIYNLMRKIGYHFSDKNKITGEMNFVKPVGVDNFPRFHIFLKVNPETQELFFNLHLDQKKPIYEGAPAHSGEYEGETIEREAERIKQIIK
jgi:hypothetical protein